ncbi:helix-turn-helix transcriptional regulator [Vibrio breoganii]|uniref:helix-turn-helix transcriptional regulator n=1 Tax=Vibrio breoganii TaxID=553239 RepID=UPI000C831BF9|nr:AlpA family phage regulatory protein [Vibrio breoganii]PMP04566.1 AlpA family phage regulatory protein [Vibrio breoganii]PMP08912.1 AlpA family phage regulatory protein [Vibrio breoganii]
MTSSKLLTYSDLEQRYNRNYRTIWTWVKEGKFPQPVKLNGRTLGWKPELVEAFENTH